MEVVQVSQTIPAQVVTLVVALAIHLALINAIVFIVVIVQAAIVAINVQIAKLVIHNVIQTINNYLNPSHVCPSPAWQLPPPVNILHQLYTSLQS